MKEKYVTMHDEKANMANKYEHSIPEGYEARIEGNKVVIERKPTEEDKMQEALHKVICRSINDPNLPYQEREYISKSVLPYFEHLVELKKEKPEEWGEDDKEVMKEIIGHCQDLVRKNKDDKVMSSIYESWLTCLKKWEAKDKYERLAPIYEDKESFEAALEEAWKFYNTSGSCLVDGFEDNHTELTFAKGFREGFLYKEKQNPTTEEWSEEDREMRMKILKYLSTRCNVNEYEEVEDWLNKIRPNWRPTKEQMEMLSYAMERNDKVGSVLLSLYNDLKKL